MAKDFHQFLSKKGLDVNARTLQNSAGSLFSGCGGGAVSPGMWVPVFILISDLSLAYFIACIAHWQ